MPEALPADLRVRLQAWLSKADAVLLQGFIRPGCTHLILDVEVNGPPVLPAAGLAGSTGSTDADVAGGGRRVVAGAPVLVDACDELAARLLLSHHVQPSDAVAAVPSCSSTACCGGAAAGRRESSTAVGSAARADGFQVSGGDHGGLAQQLASVLGPELASHSLTVQCGRSVIQLEKGEVVSCSCCQAGATACSQTGEQLLQLGAPHIVAVQCGHSSSVVGVALKAPTKAAPCRFHLRALGRDHSCEARPVAPCLPGSCSAAARGSCYMDVWDITLPALPQPCLAILEVAAGRHLSNWVPLLALDDACAVAELNAALGAQEPRDLVPADGSGIGAHAHAYQQAKPLLIALGRILDTCTLWGDVEAAARDVPECAPDAGVAIHIQLPTSPLTIPNSQPATDLTVTVYEAECDAECDEGEEGEVEPDVMHCMSPAAGSTLPPADHPMFAPTRTARLQALAHGLLPQLYAAQLPHTAGIVSAALRSGGLGGEAFDDDTISAIAAASVAHASVPCDTTATANHVHRCPIAAAPQLQVPLVQLQQRLTELGLQRANTHSKALQAGSAGCDVSSVLVGGAPSGPLSSSTSGPVSGQSDVSVCASSPSAWCEITAVSL